MLSAGSVGQKCVGKEFCSSTLRSQRSIHSYTKAEIEWCNGIDSYLIIGRIAGWAASAAREAAKGFADSASEPQRRSSSADHSASQHESECTTFRASDIENKKLRRGGGIKMWMGHNNGTIQY